MKYLIFLTKATALLFPHALACEDHNTSVAATTTKQNDDAQRKTEDSWTCLEMQECIKGCLKEAEKIEEETPTPDSVDETNTTVVVNISQCGEGEWRRIAHLNMSDPNQSCPSRMEWDTCNTCEIVWKKRYQFRNTMRLYKLHNWWISLQQKSAEELWATGIRAYKCIHTLSVNSVDQIAILCWRS